MTSQERSEIKFVRLLVRVNCPCVVLVATARVCNANDLVIVLQQLLISFPDFLESLESKPWTLSCMTVTMDDS